MTTEAEAKAAEPCPPNLDAEAQDIWNICSWIIDGGKIAPSIGLQLDALHIRRQLRLESDRNDAEQRGYAAGLEAARQRCQKIVCDLLAQTSSVTDPGVVAADQCAAAIRRLRPEGG